MNKTRQWAQIRRELKKKFERAGITSCEFGFEGCWHDNGLSFAHADKRRYLSTAQLWQVTLACPVCHGRIELMQRADMRALVLSVIARRLSRFDNNMGDT